MRKDKIRIEIDHAERICDRADIVWGWSSAAGKRRVSRRIDRFMEFLGNKNNPRILEIGGGTGIFSRHLARHNLNLTAVDISPAFIKRSREATGRGVGYVQGDVESLPFKDNSFDAVFAISVLHHLDLEQTLKEIARVLRKGGKLFITEPNTLNPQVFFVKNVGFVKRRYHWVPHETAFLRWSLKRKLETADFCMVSVENFDFVHPAIPDFLVSLVERVGGYLEKIPIIKELSGSLMIRAVRG